MIDIRWYEKLDGTKVLELNRHGYWEEVDTVSEYNERKHQIGKYAPAGGDLNDE